MGAAEVSAVQPLQPWVTMPAVHFIACAVQYRSTHLRYMVQLQLLKQALPTPAAASSLLPTAVSRSSSRCTGRRRQALLLCIPGPRQLLHVTAAGAVRGLSGWLRRAVPVQAGTAAVQGSPATAALSLNYLPCAPLCIETAACNPAAALRRRQLRQAAVCDAYAKGEVEAAQEEQAGRLSQPRICAQGAVMGAKRQGGKQARLSMLAGLSKAYGTQLQDQHQARNASPVLKSG